MAVHCCANSWISDLFGDPEQNGGRAGTHERHTADIASYGLRWPKSERDWPKTDSRSDESMFGCRPALAPANDALPGSKRLEERLTS